MDECATDPCHNGGVCFERSNQAYYGTRPDFPRNFSYSQAAGFLCQCQPGFAGEQRSTLSSCLCLVAAAWFEWMGREQCYPGKKNPLTTGASEGAAALVPILCVDVAGSCVDVVFCPTGLSQGRSYSYALSHRFDECPLAMQMPGGFSLSLSHAYGRIYPYRVSVKLLFRRT